PLVPLGLFTDRNFSLANVGISAVGFAVTALGFPLMLYTQAVLGYTPTQAALLLVPMAVMSILLARFVGRLTDRVHPRYLAGFGTFTVSVSLVWLSRVMAPDAEVWQLLLPITLLGIGSSFMWSPLGTSATRNLPMDRAGAGAGVYNTTRQVGSVLGSAGIAALMQSRLVVHLPQLTGGQVSRAEGGATRLPEPLQQGFAAAMADSLLLPAAVVLVACVAALFFARPRHLVRENS
ncbi:MAG TPA: MFS transporter, partial [Microlunatus sp.]|nr:MFS transporter [Microlunatus sp.]